MGKKVYVLAVGIDTYAGPVRPLRGCGNDIQALLTLLEDRTRAAGADLVPLRLLDGEATREAVIGAVRSHLHRAGPGDAALLYFSGHGSQEKAPPEFRHLEPGGRNQTLVCFDSRLPGGYDLADKEVGALLAEVAAGGAHVLAVFDCCHAGGITRDSGEDVLGVRHQPAGEEVRPLESYLFAPETLAGMRARGPAQGWFVLPESRAAVISACEAFETAKEVRAGDGEVRGALSAALETALRQLPPNVSLRDVFGRVSTVIRHEVEAQTPQLEAGDVRDLDRPFLGGAVAARPPSFTLRHAPGGEWEIDAGTLHGLRPPEGGETTTLAVLDLGSPPAGWRDPRASLGTARVTEVGPSASRVRLTLREGAAPDSRTTYRAVVLSAPLPRTPVILAGEAQGVGLLRDALAQAGGQVPSLFVREATTPGNLRDAGLRVLAADGAFRLTRPHTDRLLVPEVPGLTPEGARLVVARLEHVARWEQTRDLLHGDTRLPPDAVELTAERLRPGSGADGVALTAEPLPLGGPLRLEYEFRDGRWVQPQLRLRLRNTTGWELHCALLDLPETFAVVAGLTPGGCLRLGPGEEITANGGRPIYPAVPRALWEEGRTEFTDVLKLIVSERPFDATLLAQDALDVPRGGRGDRPVPRSALDRLLSRVQTRDLGPAPEDADEHPDWTTGTWTFTTVRPREAAPVPAVGESAALGGGVTLLGHPGLRARARLTSLPQAARGEALFPPIPSLPAWLAENPDVAPFAFVATRGDDPGLGVLELLDVENPAAVTEKAPLVLRLNAPLGPGEHLLPLAFDAAHGLFLPLGAARAAEGGTELRLERLPTPDPSERSLLGAVRIFVQKVVRQQLGRPPVYPQLRVAEVAEDGAVTYLAEREAIRARVAASRRVLLYVHGIFGDTDGMAASFHTGHLGLNPAPPALAPGYDLVLAYAYESFDAEIEESARALGEQLAEVGLGPGHGRVLHAVGHSMGGCVLRWFVEQGGGADRIGHLVMLGTPNGGSPWPTVQAWATALLAFGLNHLPGLDWPGKALGALLGAVERFDQALDQLAPTSDFMRKLGENPDPGPGVRYTVIAGNTSLRPDALRGEDGAPSLADRLLGLLSRDGALRAVGDRLFGEPNDVAVSVRSTFALPPAWAGRAEVRVVPCDHLTYFDTAAGLSALAAALGEPALQTSSD
ncbi:hypothetical protein DAETH_41830 (plasmid) [Deinococcus aetherius]|uniref:Peptidase C14 caspase catalytic subunit p20 n=1 Tax=Deinococcus aetherius TaxID=200252 RepID=A0ABM8AK59_9DEIO|nr:caspase family protein [Deinococcus aetherius]BDP44214.1 hypothetical protein DAETH_41830 [Deinococcus aetherius]